MMIIKEKFYDFAVSDFDGTIFNSNGEVSSATVNSINGFISRGGTFCVCTGRMTTSIIPFLNKFGINKGFVITYNGAEICNIETGEKIFKRHIDTDNAVKMLKYAENFNFDLMVYPNDIITVEKTNKTVEEYFSLSKTKGRIINSKVSDFMQKNQLTTGKGLFLTGGDENIACKILKDLPNILGDEFTVVRSNKYHIDVMKSGVSKGNAIKEFAKIMNKDLNKLICFGDEMNDESMIRVAAVGAVVSSGSDKLKEIADLIIDPCDNDGVSKAMEKYCI